MEFRLFSQLSFEVVSPIAVIESHCFQTNFYASFDLVPLENRRIEHVNRIGARIPKSLLSECWDVIKQTKDLNIFDYDLDKFLKLSTTTRNDYVEEFNEKTIKRLLKIDGIGFSKATKIVHTFHPEIIPMIDNQLQAEYQERINRRWKPENPQIFIDYYNNLKERSTSENLDKVFQECSKNNLRLTKVRVFDILWWSFLKAKRLGKQRSIKWSTMEWRTNLDH